MALHLWMTKASDVWYLLIPGHSPALSSSTWRFSAIDSMTLIFWFLHSSGTSGIVVVVVVAVVVLVVGEVSWLTGLVSRIKLIMLSLIF